MRNDMGLRYKSLKFGAPEANTQRCLVLRQQYALKVFEPLKNDMTLYAIDESWVDQLNFTRSHWGPRHYRVEG